MLLLEDLRLEASAFEARIRAGIRCAHNHAEYADLPKPNKLHVLQNDQGPAFDINAHYREAISSTFSAQLHLSKVDWRIAICETLADIAVEHYEIEIKPTVEAACRAATLKKGSEVELADVILDSKVDEVIAILRDRLITDICDPVKLTALTARINRGLANHLEAAGQDPLFLDEAQLKMFAVKLNNRVRSERTWFELGAEQRI